MQYSWQEYRCQNCNRVPPGSSKDDTPAPKRSKAAAMNNHSYPSLVGEPEEETAHARNCSLLKTELRKARPDRESIFNLMERTFITGADPGHQVGEVITNLILTNRA